VTAALQSSLKTIVSLCNSLMMMMMMMMMTMLLVLLNLASKERLVNVKYFAVFCCCFLANHLTRCVHYLGVCFH